MEIIESILLVLLLLDVALLVLLNFLCFIVDSHVPVLDRSDHLGKHRNGSSPATAKVCFRNSFNGLVLHARKLFPNTKVIRRHAIVEPIL